MSVVLAVIVDKPDVIESGCPEVQLKIPPNCQLSTNRDTQPGAFESSFRFGPNGRSYVPLLVMACVRWKPSSCLLAERLFGSRYAVPPSPSASPRVRLQV